MRSQIEAIDINPLHWLGDAASAVVGNAWMAAMTGLWSAALWLLRLAFRIIDAFTTPDLSPDGPMGAVLPTTLWLGAALAVIMMFVQLTLALLRRDGKSMGHVLIGIGQFGLVWLGFLGVAGGLVAAAAGLERGILRAMLQSNDLSHVDLSGTFPDKVVEITLATVLGILGLLIVVPASFFYVLIMFVREAALIILVATAPISAAGLVSETGKAWFWKTLRWFFACLLISPMAALLLGIGVKLSNGVIHPPTPPKTGSGASLQTTVRNLNTYANQNASAHAGMAVVGCIIIAIGACCPLILFRLLAFVEPGTASGAALRQSWSDAGGMAGVVGGSKSSDGSSAATQSSADGRSSGEAGAESHTTSRLASAMGAFGAGVGAVASMANRAADLGSDILGQAGVGHPGYSMTPTDERGARQSGGAHNGTTDGHSEGETGSGPSGAGKADIDTPPPPSPPPAPPGGEAGAPGAPGPQGPHGPTGPEGPGSGAGADTDAAAAAV